MSENSNIYNIFSRLSNYNNIKEDLNEALCLIEKHFKHKYLTPIEQDIRCCSQNCASEPTKEITLLNQHDIDSPFPSYADNIQEDGHNLSSSSESLPVGQHLRWI